MKQYLISSTKFNIVSRKTQKHGTVYDARFYIYEAETGKQIHKKITGCKTKAEAKYKHDHFITEFCEITKNPEELLKKKHAADAADLLFEDAMERYFLSCVNQTKTSSIVARKSRIELYVLPCFKGKKMSQITKQDLYDWQDRFWTTKKKDGTFLSSNYMQSVRGTFFTIMEWYSERSNVPNPFRGIKMPKKRLNKTDMQFWTKSEFETFIEFVDNPTLKTLFYMLFFTGRRVGEVVALSPSDVKSKEIVFNKTYTTKTGNEKAYEITSTKADKIGKTPISPSLKKQLDQYAVPKGKFFFGGENPVPMQTIRYNFLKSIEKAGVKQIRIHDLRHSFVSMLIHEGANMMVVADLISDNVDQVMKTYGHLYQSDKISIMQRI